MSIPLQIVSGRQRQFGAADDLDIDVISLRDTGAATDLTIGANMTGADGEVQLGTAANDTRVMGDLFVDGAATVASTTSLNGSVNLGDGTGDIINVGGGGTDVVNLLNDLEPGAGGVGLGTGVTEYFDEAWLEVITGSPADGTNAAVDINAGGTLGADRLTAGANAIGVGTSALTNLAGAPVNPDLQTVLEAIDFAIGSGGGASLQTAYDVLSTITENNVDQNVTIARGTNTTNEVLALTDNTSAVAQHVLTVDKSPTGVALGDGISITNGANSTGKSLDIVHAGTDAAVAVAAQIAYTGGNAGGRGLIVSSNATGADAISLSWLPGAAASAGNALSVKGNANAEAGPNLLFRIEQSDSGDAIEMDHRGIEIETAGGTTTSWDITADAEASASSIVGTNITITSGAGAASGGAAAAAGGTLVGTAGKGGDGDGANADALGGALSLSSGDSGSGGVSGARAGNVSLQVGSSSGGTTPIIAIGTSNTADITIGTAGASGNDATVNHAKVADGSTGLQSLGLNVGRSDDGSAGGAATEVGAYAIGVNAQTLTNITMPNNTLRNLQDVLEAFNSAVTSGSTLQSAYDAGRTIDIGSVTETLPVNITNSTNANDNLTVSRTFVGSGDGVAVDMGPGGQAVTGNGVSISLGSGSTAASNGVYVTAVAGAAGNLYRATDDSAVDVWSVSASGNVVAGVDGALGAATFVKATKGANLEISAIADFDVLVGVQDTGAITMTGAAPVAGTGGNFSVSLTDGASATATSGDIVLSTVATAGAQGGVAIGTSNAVVTPSDLETLVIAKDSTGPSSLTLTRGPGGVTLKAEADIAANAAPPLTLNSVQSNSTSGDAGAVELSSKVTKAASSGSASTVEVSSKTIGSGNAGAVTVSSQVTGAGTGDSADVTIKSTSVLGDGGDVIIFASAANGTEGGIVISAAPGGGTPNTPAAGQLLLESTDEVQVDSSTVDVNATSAITIDSGAGVSIDAAAASNFSSSVGDITIETSSTTGSIRLLAGTGGSGGDITFDARGATAPLTYNDSAEVDLDYTGAGEVYNGVTSVVGALNAIADAIVVSGAISVEIAIENGVTVAVGDVVAASATAGRCTQGDANADTNGDFLGIAKVGGTGDVGGTVFATVVAAGKVTDSGAAFTQGALFMPDGTGRPTNTAPSGTGDLVLRVGFAYSATEYILQVGEGTVL